MTQNFVTVAATVDGLAIQNHVNAYTAAISAVLDAESVGVEVTVTAGGVVLLAVANSSNSSNTTEGRRLQTDVCTQAYTPVRANVTMRSFVERSRIEELIANVPSTLPYEQGQSLVQCGPTETTLDNVVTLGAPPPPAKTTEDIWFLAGMIVLGVALCGVCACACCGRFFGTGAVAHKDGESRNNNVGYVRTPSEKQPGTITTEELPMADAIQSLP